MARTLAVSEREREAIAADVRKGPVQELEAISRALTDLRASVPAERHGLLDRLNTAVGSAAGSLRRMIIDLYPRDPRVAALGATLEDLAAPLRAEGIEVSVQYTPLPELSPETAAAIYRTAKEALTNVSRHAGAGHVWVSLEPAGDPRAPAVRLCIDDDGLGFPATLLDRRQEGHLGLRLVADRANDAGGTLELGERPGGGASLTVCFPAAPPS
jgi:signal transduction histidine kinase